MDTGIKAGSPGTDHAVKAAITLTAIYVAAQILADIGSLKIAMFLGLSMDAGTLVYPITFTLRDLLHKRLGKAAAQRAVILAGVINLAMALYFQIVCALQPDATWPLNEAFVSVLGPVWRIVLASIAAEVLSELVDGEVYQVWTGRMGGRLQWMRVLVSNAVSVPLDSAVFCLGAFAFSLDWPTVFSIFLANVILKGVVTLVSLPGIYLVKEGVPGKGGTEGSTS